MIKSILLFTFFLGISVADFAAPATAIDTKYSQEDILPVAPDDTAAFVAIFKPQGEPVEVTILSRQGEWEEVRLYYHFKFNASTDPTDCAMSLFKGTFTGFRRAETR